MSEMITKNIQQFIKYLKCEKENCLQKSDALIKDHRKDEADMLKIRANIFDIITTISKTALNRFPQDSISFIKEKINTIPSSWKKSLKLAEKNEDHAKIEIEHIKLQAIEEIDEAFMKILENIV